MIYLFISTLLFGLVHPLSKIILDGGIPLSYFCVLFISFRLIILFPLFIKQRVSPQSLTGFPKKHLFPLLALGVCGASLQYLEFKGINQGIAPGTVTFLMFSYPIWLFLLDLFKKKNNSPMGSLLKLILGSLGIVLVCQPNSSDFVNSPVHFIFPLLASFFLAGWVYLSSHLKKKNLATLDLTFYYDLISLVLLLIALAKPLASHWTLFVQWSEQSSNILQLAGYAIFIGLVPNLLFYHGSQFAPAMTIALIMALEPIFSTLYSYFLWKHTLSRFFFLGALLLIGINLPWERVFPCKNVSWKRFLFQLKKTFYFSLRS